MLTVGRSARDLLLKKCTLAAWSKKKVTERGFNVYLNERTNVALNKLFSESSVIAPHGTAAIKNGTTGVFQDPSSDSYWSTWGGQRHLPNNGAPHDTSRTLWGRWRWKGSPLRVNIRLGAAVGRPRAGSIHCHERPCSSTSKSHQASMICSSVLCENHARKMRTFFTRRLEPKTRSSYHIKWSNAKWNTLKQSFS